MSQTLKLSEFALAYITCAMWSSTDNATPSGGEPLDSNCSRDDIDPQTLINMALEADAFATTNREDIEAAAISDSRAGHCFWLNRNGHGSGFWDEYTSRDPDEWREACKRLDKASKAAGSRDLYLGDDGKIYQL